MALSLQFEWRLTLASLLLSSAALAQGQPGGPGAVPAPQAPTSPAEQGITQASPPSGSPGTSDQNPLLLPTRQGRATGPSERTLRLSLAPEVLLGGSVRIGDSATGYAFDERYSVNFQGGLYLGIGPWVDVGAYYLHSGLGTEAVTGTGNLSGIDSRRTLDAAMLEARVNPLRSDWARLFLGVNLGLGWQSVDHRGTPNQGDSGLVDLTVKTKCDATDGPSLGLGGSLGGDFDVGAGWEFLARGSMTVFRFSSDPVKNDGVACTAGAGSSTMAQIQLGFRYRFDLGKGTMVDKQTVGFSSPATTTPAAF